MVIIRQPEDLRWLLGKTIEALESYRIEAQEGHGASDVLQLLFNDSTALCIQSQDYEDDSSFLVLGSWER